MTDISIIEARNNPIVKSNELIQNAMYDLTVMQQKIVNYLISKIMPEDNDFKLYQFSIQEFCCVCGIDANNGGNYKMIKEQILDIAKITRWITIDDGKKVATVRWIEKAYISPNSGIVEIRLDKDLKPHLLQLKTGYTKIILRDILRFKSKYAFRLYDLIKSIHFHEDTEYHFTYKLEELQKKLGAENYKTYATFKTRALIPAVNDINRYSDKTIDYVPEKIGNKVVKITLIIKTKSADDIAAIRAECEDELNQINTINDTVANLNKIGW